MSFNNKSLEYCYINFKGSGNINSDLWIFGFEPGGNPYDESQKEYREKIENADEESFIQYLNEPLEDEIEGNTYYIIKDLLEKFNRKNCLNQNGTHFNINADSDVFFSNLFPLKFPAEKDQRNESILNMYKKHFNNIDSSDPNERKFYKDSWIIERYKSQFSNFNNGEKRVIIVTKVNYDKTYLKLIFGDGDWRQKKIGTEKYGTGITNIYEYRKENSYIYFIPNRKIDNIIKIVFDEARDKLNDK